MDWAVLHGRFTREKKGKRLIYSEQKKTAFLVLALGSALCSMLLIGPSDLIPSRMLSEFIPSAPTGDRIDSSRLLALKTLPSSIPPIQNPIAPQLNPLSLKLIERPQIKEPSVHFHMISKTYQVNKGDTLGTVLTRAGLPRDQIVQVVQSIRPVFNLRSLKLGQSIQLKLKKERSAVSLVNLRFNPSGEQSICLQTLPSGKIHAKKIQRQLIRSLRQVEGRIGSSFYAASLKAGVPASLVKEAINALSHNVNWQHDPKRGDPFKFLFEVHTDSDGRLVKTGDLRFVSFAPKGLKQSIYRHILKDKTVGYYNAAGQSITRTLLMTPLEPTKMRITSKFGLRRDPTMQGYHRHHKGIDYGAPTGTPVMAAGSGIIKRASYYGNYGNYISIRHNKEYSTAYAHLSRYAKGIRPGVRVKQGQLIGYVGTTGRSTGPHLHYEVIYRGSQINPASIKQLPGKKLDRSEFSRFQLTKVQVDKMIQGKHLSPESRPSQSSPNDSAKNLYAVHYRTSYPSKVAG